MSKSGKWGWSEGFYRVVCLLLILYVAFSSKVFKGYEQKIDVVMKANEALLRVCAASSEGSDMSNRYVLKGLDREQHKQGEYNEKSKKK